MIEVREITKTYGPIEALKKVTFDVPKGQIVGFLGANGAGKTTTMDILCGSIGPDSGEAKIAGFDITDAPIKAKRKIGYLPDEPPLHADMRVEDYVKYAARLHGLSHREVTMRTEDTLDRLELRQVRSRLIGNLSKGYKQRVGLAQALVHNPDVLILDEPTEGLDPNQILQIRELIQSLRGEHTIVLSSHILSEVQNTCDQIIIIDKGEVVAQGPYAELVKQLSEGQSFHLKVRERASELIHKLESIQGLTTVQLKSEVEQLIDIGIRGLQENTLDQVAKAVIEGGFGLRELTPQSKSLEDVFFQLTHKHEV